MSLETIISYGLTQPDKDLNALVLMGGGARTAYQAGVLNALARMLSLQAGTVEPYFPFKILVGTSAGALNACYLPAGPTKVWPRSGNSPTSGPRCAQSRFTSSRCLAGYVPAGLQPHCFCRSMSGSSRLF